MTLSHWLGLLLLAISLYILWQIRQVLLLVFAAIVLATALNRLARKLQRIRIKNYSLNRSLAVLLSIFFLLALLVGFVWLIVPPFAVEFQQLTKLLPMAFKRVNYWLNNFSQLVPPALAQYLPTDIVNLLGEQLQPLVEQLPGKTVSFFFVQLGVLLQLLLVLVLTFMMLAQPTSYRQAFVRLFPSFYRRRVERILDLCEESLGRWIVGALISMSVVALLSVIGLTILKVRLALAQGVLAGILNLIPNIGPTISVVLPMAISLLDVETPWKPLLVLLLYFLIQQFESNFLTPYVMAQQVSLLPAITLLAQIFFASFFGFLGLLLALPLTVVGQVWLQEVLLKDILDKWQADTSEEEYSMIAKRETVEGEDSQAADYIPSQDYPTEAENVDNL